MTDCSQANKRQRVSIKKVGEKIAANQPFMSFEDEHKKQTEFIKQTNEKVDDAKKQIPEKQNRIASLKQEVEVLEKEQKLLEHQMPELVSQYNTKLQTENDVLEMFRKSHASAVEVMNALEEAKKKKEGQAVVIKRKLEEIEAANIELSATHELVGEQSRALENARIQEMWLANQKNLSQILGSPLIPRISPAPAPTPASPAPSHGFFNSISKVFGKK